VGMSRKKNEIMHPMDVTIQISLRGHRFRKTYETHGSPLLNASLFDFVSSISFLVLFSSCLCASLSIQGGRLIPGPTS
jgi:hypothetical protein